MALVQKNGVHIRLISQWTTHAGTIQQNGLPKGNLSKQIKTKHLSLENIS